ncbi:MAG: hypothetical protein ACXVIJ_08480 [Thermoanaerobaculia bacterium]
MKKVIGLTLLSLCVTFVPVTASAAQSSRQRLWTDATRLAALLSDSQKNVNFDANTWHVVAVEANMLANHIYANAGTKASRALATDLRTHVRKFRDAALNGDAAGARTHASEALPFAYQLIEWSAPKM